MEVRNFCNTVRLHTCRQFRSYSASFDQRTPFATTKQVSEIIDLLRRGENDLSSKMNGKNVTLSIPSCVKIFHILSREKVSALRFFDWLRATCPEFGHDSHICSLVIDNCGRLENYEAMVLMLKEFNLKCVRLEQKAFGFLLDSSCHKASLMESTEKVMSVLYEVGGSCQTSGVWSLIEMFCVSGSFDIAEFVIVTAGRKVNHYNVLIREFCRRRDCERAWKLLKEMKQNGCAPNITSYNMVMSCLCTNERFAEATQMLEAIEKDYGLPDASTCDIFINYLCKRGHFDLVLEFLERMIGRGIEPCIASNAAIIKAYFRSKKYEEAHKFVVDSVTKQRYSSNANYSLLAALHLKKGNVLMASMILHEMMDKGLKPNFRVCMSVSKRLEKSNTKAMQSELMSRYWSIIEK
ncbi:hypothetical protein K1719_032377 [Acacia pycnantha]|nr:hypothetical protein K1719_032377 [Acacia pycnantha]